jgi:ribosomal protein S18 acetylase RimI-like enzyme
MLNLHLRRLAGLGTRTVFLEVGEGNIPATRLYQRAGFRMVGRREGYYPDRTDKNRVGDYPGQSGKSTAALVLRCDLP